MKGSDPFFRDGWLTICTFIEPAEVETADEKEYNYTDCFMTFGQRDREQYKCERYIQNIRE